MISSTPDIAPHRARLAKRGRVQTSVFLQQDSAQRLRAEVPETFTAYWNSPSLFRVPHPHVVTQEARWALDARYSITGWLRRS